MLTRLRQSLRVTISGLFVAGVVWLAWRLHESKSNPNASVATAPLSSVAAIARLEAPEPLAPSTAASPTHDPQPIRQPEGSAEPGTDLPPAPCSEEAFWHELTRLRALDKKQALTYALRGEQWYGSEGRPAEARRAMIVSLLVDLDRMEEARTRTREFIGAYPHSSYRVIVQGLTGIHPRPGAPARLQAQREAD